MMQAVIEALMERKRIIACIQEIFFQSRPISLLKRKVRRLYHRPKVRNRGETEM